MVDKLNADRPIPAIDLSATTPAGLYSLDAIVTNSELEMIDAESIYSLPDEASRLAAMPYKYDRVCPCLILGILDLSTTVSNSYSSKKQRITND